jgi:hypothetical protein
MPPAHHLDPVLSPHDVLGSLPEPVRRLAQVVATLYGGCCDAASDDVRRRHAKRPYLYRIDLDGLDVLDWLHRFKTYEIARGERLADALTLAETRS